VLLVGVASAVSSKAAVGVSVGGWLVSSDSGVEADVFVGGGLGVSLLPTGALQANANAISKITRKLPGHFINNFSTMSTLSLPLDYLVGIILTISPGAYFLEG
jgi:hypothetical protein